MNYPLISEYIETIKSAEDNFDKLSYLRPILGDDGLPVMSAGGFSVVFKMKDEQSGKFYAVKCFTKEQEGRNESYKLIADELEYVSSNYLIPIKYYENELFVDTNNSDKDEFPVLLMDWVEGKTLDVYIKENINEQYALEMLAYQFNKMATWLITQPFAHGDLKPDNILVKEKGQIVLMDYDGMYVPAMKGQKAKEIGSPDFRHPLRTEDDFNERMDDFSLSCIALSLKAISIDSSLMLGSNNGNGLLLFEKDIQDIANSKKMEFLNSLSKDLDYLRLLGAFYICYANKDFSNISFKLFDIIKPNKKHDISIFGSFTDQRDGNVYKTIKIGKQIWLAENLRYLPSINNGHYVYGYNGNDLNSAKNSPNYKLFGVLYNMEAAQNACPKGWHIPSDVEWLNLEQYFGLTDYDKERIVMIDDINGHFRGHHGCSMTEGALWKDGLLKQTAIKDGLFNAIPAGWRTYYRQMQNAFELSKWWTSTRSKDRTQSGILYFYRGLYYKDDGIERDQCDISCCLSLRCVKDDDLTFVEQSNVVVLPF